MARVAVAAIAVAAVIPLSRGAAAASPDELVRAVNVTRGEAGAPALHEDASLDAIALDHSEQMSEAGRIFHNLQLGSDADAHGILWTTLGENVGSGANVDQIERALVASPHHYANLVNPEFTRVGVGEVADAKGRVYITQVFATLYVPPARPIVRTTPVIRVPEFKPRAVVARPPDDRMRTEDGHLVPEIFFSAPPLPDDGWLGTPASDDAVGD